MEQFILGQATMAGVDMVQNNIQGASDLLRLLAEHCKKAVQSSPESSPVEPTPLASQLFGSVLVERVLRLSQLLSPQAAGSRTSFQLLADLMRHPLGYETCLQQLLLVLDMRPQEVLAGWEVALHSLRKMELGLGANTPPVGVSPCHTPGTATPTKQASPSPLAAMLSPFNGFAPSAPASVGCPSEDGYSSDVLLHDDAASDASLRSDMCSRSSHPGNHYPGSFTGSWAVQQQAAHNGKAAALWGSSAPAPALSSLRNPLPSSLPSVPLPPLAPRGAFEYRGANLRDVVVEADTATLLELACQGHPRKALLLEDGVIKGLLQHARNTYGQAVFTELLSAVESQDVSRSRNPAKYTMKHLKAVCDDAIARHCPHLAGHQQQQQHHQQYHQHHLMHHQQQHPHHQQQLQQQHMQRQQLQHMQQLQLQHMHQQALLNSWVC